MKEGLPVSGYRPQSDDKIDAVNINKQHEELTLRRLDELKNMPGIDQRWLAIGRTSLEQAYMAINRAIFQPSRIGLPTDTNS